MDWQVSDFNNSWRPVLQGRVRKNPAFQDPAIIEASAKLFSSLVGIIDAELEKTGAYITGSQFTLADIVIGLSLNRWRTIPMTRPDYRHVARYFDLLLERKGFARFGPGAES
jgi:glutathione S-transferase